MDGFHLRVLGEFVHPSESDSQVDCVLPVLYLQFFTIQLKGFGEGPPLLAIAVTGNLFSPGYL